MAIFDFVDHARPKRSGYAKPELTKTLFGVVLLAEQFAEQIHEFRVAAI